MASNSDFEIPESLRELAAKSVEQARQAYEQFLDQSRKAQDMIARSSASMGESVKEIQAKAMRCTEENMRAGFELATRLAQARSVREALEVQAEYARKQVETYARQARELAELMAKAGSKS